MAKIGGGKPLTSPAEAVKRQEMAKRVLHQRRLNGIDDAHVDPDGDARIERRLRLRDDEARSRK